MLLHAMLAPGEFCSLPRLMLLSVSDQIFTYGAPGPSNSPVGG